MTLRPREKVLLGLLVGVAAFQGVRLLTGALGDGPLSLATIRKSAVRQAAEILTAQSVSELELARLAAAGGTTEIGRDPFRFSTARATERTVVAPPPRPRPRRNPDSEAGALGSAGGPPSFPLRFLGSFGRTDRPIAVFSDGEAIINAFVGDTLQDAFIVNAIGREVVEIGFVDFPDRPSERRTIGD